MLRILLAILLRLGLMSFILRIAEAECEYDDGYASSCPSPCTCSSKRSQKENGDDVIVDCSRLQLTQIPVRLPASTSRLLLAGNEIEAVRRRDLLNCRTMELVDISENRLSRMESNSMDSLVNLKQLFLNNNQLIYGTLPVNIFDKLENLRVLKIHNNNWRNSSVENYDRLFSHLTALEDLSLDRLPDVRLFGPGFSNMVHLRKLSIHGGLYDVLNDTFRAFRRSPIETLTLATSTNLRSLEPLSFGHFPTLSTLDLSFNQGLGIENVSNAWWGLQFTNISRLILSRIIPEDVVECKITPAFFRYLDRTNITTLLLDKNNIVRFEPLLHEKLPKLEHFDFSFNRLSNVASFMLDTWRLKRLKFLDVSHQAKRYLFPADSSDFRQSPAIGGQPGETRSIGRDGVGDWTTDCHTEQLKMCLKEIFRWSSMSAGRLHRDFPLDYGPWCLPISPRLEVVNLTASLNVELNRMPSIIVFGGQHLRRLEYRRNGVSKMTGHVIMTMPCESLSVDYGDNGVTCFSPDIFNISRIFGCRVTELDMSGNNLAAQLQRDLVGKTFKDVSTLKILNLARNGILSLNARTFYHLELLEKLNMSQNYLKVIDFEFDHMRRLSDLDVSYNLLSSLDQETIRKLSDMFDKNYAKPDLVVDFLGNPIQCSCDTLAFLHWMRSRKDRFRNFDSYSCNVRGRVVLFSNISSTILRELDFTCSKPLALIISGSLVGLLLILVASSVCCYRYRWEIHYLCLKLTKRGHDFRVLVDRTAYDYDAFVVYDIEDRIWVYEELLPHIEGHRNWDEPVEPVDASCVTGAANTGLRLCVHERDFRPGGNIIENIWSKIESSRKTVLVISRKFVTSRYCNYEVQLARMNGVEQARNLIVPVLLEPVDLKDMSETLSWVVRRLTYIEWPASEADREEFWKRLRQAIESPD